MKTYKQFINENDNFDEYKAKIEQELKQDVTDKKTTPETKEIDNKSNDDIVESVNKEIELYTKKKSDIQEKIKKLEEILTSGEFTKENLEKVKLEKEKLTKEIENFDKMIEDSKVKISKLKGE